ncbi:unnamed protein product [Fraxinus pennsylvanica]|uniref:Uncharacterized protein n=1 Tax=Fraxinus pennsylvanica TaxID=56036 RepID=A0AAD1ZQI2_9LAMI|nr:unnamed protein product [Fraxinus pennsylvanica]
MQGTNLAARKTIQKNVQENSGDNQVKQPTKNVYDNSGEIQSTTEVPKLSSKGAEVTTIETPVPGKEFPLNNEILVGTQKNKEISQKDPINLSSEDKELSIKEDDKDEVDADRMLKKARLLNFGSTAGIVPSSPTRSTDLASPQSMLHNRSWHAVLTHCLHQFNGSSQFHQLALLISALIAWEIWLARNEMTISKQSSSICLRQELKLHRQHSIGQ